VILDIRPYGRRALLAEPTDPAVLLDLADAARSLAGVAEVVPAARTVLVVCSAPSEVEGVTHGLADLELPGGQRAGRGGGEPVPLNVTYDGPDLAAVADETGMSMDEVVHRHTGADYVVAFCGFTPGFAYLSGLPPELHLPRLPEPRTRVPAGAVGIAGGFTGVYPRPSPGGWRLLGRTSAPLWDVDRDPPALLAPGTAVRFRAT
jgi:KipI family sensor histidine kinase inhibitor